MVGTGLARGRVRAVRRVRTCKLFIKLVPEKQLAKLQEERLYLYCFRHRVDLDNLTKKQPGLQGV
jgi:hypothetical protein